MFKGRARPGARRPLFRRHLRRAVVPGVARRGDARGVESATQMAKKRKSRSRASGTARSRGSAAKAPRAQAAVAQARAPRRGAGGAERARAAPPRRDRPRADRVGAPISAVVLFAGWDGGRVGSAADTGARLRRGRGRLPRPDRPRRHRRRAAAAALHPVSERLQRRARLRARRRCSSPTRRRPRGSAPSARAATTTSTPTSSPSTAAPWARRSTGRSTTLFQRPGAHILAVLLFVTGLLLLSGTTVSAIAGRGARRCGAPEAPRPSSRAPRARRAAATEEGRVLTEANATEPFETDLLDRRGRRRPRGGHARDHGRRAAAAARATASRRR